MTFTQILHHFKNNKTDTPSMFGVLFYLHLVDFYGFHVGKYTIQPDGIPSSGAAGRLRRNGPGTWMWEKFMRSLMGLN